MADNNSVKVVVNNDTAEINGTRNGSEPPVVRRKAGSTVSLMSKRRTIASLMGDRRESQKDASGTNLFQTVDTELENRQQQERDDLLKMIERGKQRLENAKKDKSDSSHKSEEAKEGESSEKTESDVNLLQQLEEYKQLLELKERQVQSVTNVWKDQMKMLKQEYEEELRGLQDKVQNLEKELRSEKEEKENQKKSAEEQHQNECKVWEQKEQELLEQLKKVRAQVVEMQLESKASEAEEKAFQQTVRTTDNSSQSEQREYEKTSTTPTTTTTAEEDKLVQQLNKKLHILKAEVDTLTSRYEAERERNKQLAEELREKEKIFLHTAQALKQLEREREREREREVKDNIEDNNSDQFVSPTSPSTSLSTLLSSPLSPSLPPSPFTPPSPLSISSTSWSSSPSHSAPHSHSSSTTQHPDSPTIDDLNNLKETLAAHLAQNSFLSREIMRVEKSKEESNKMWKQQIVALENEISQLSRINETLRLDLTNKAGVDEEKVEISRELFFTMAIGIKLNSSIQGKGISNINISALWEKACKANVSFREYHTWIFKQFSLAAASAAPASPTASSSASPSPPSSLSSSSSSSPSSSPSSVPTPSPAPSPAPSPHSIFYSSSTGFSNMFKKSN